jgi:hypothetical protein
MKDEVFTILQSMLQASPEASYKRLNPALRCTLSNCISADLPFQPDTFRRIYNELRGGWWFGDGAGSHVGEHFYSQACSLNHASAVNSFERFAERPGVLWEQDVRTPERLHVGSRFSWKGRFVEVTSMRKESLVACTYKDSRDLIKDLKVGALVSYSNPHVITSAKRDGKAVLLRVVKAPATHGERTVARRFTINYEEIATFRRTEKARLKAVLETIATCDPKDAAKLSKQIAREHFRHFQLEEINAAFAKRKYWIANEERIKAWRGGVNGAWLDVKGILLRVSGDAIECSNGNSVSIGAARRILPIILDRRRSTGSLDLPLDAFRIRKTEPAGVTVDCTLIPWSEIDYIKPRLLPD